MSQDWFEGDEVNNEQDLKEHVLDRVSTLEARSRRE
jgi:hypothetical protein